jgi:hypothetical protein
MHAMRLVDDPDGRRARSFGGVADEFDRARPSYPREAVRWLVGSGGLDVVDLGAGTGKLTAVLLDEGHRVVAIEPLEPLRAKLTAALPTVQALQGRAEQIPLPDCCADAVLVGQAFHWFDIQPALERSLVSYDPAGRSGCYGISATARRRGCVTSPRLPARTACPKSGGESSRCSRQSPPSSDATSNSSIPSTATRSSRVVSTWSIVASLAEPERGQMLGRVRTLWDGHPDLGRASHASLIYRTEAYRVHLT